MKVPSSININTLKAYKTHPKSISNEKRTTESFNLERWDEQLPKCLQEICVESIAKNWKENPILDEIVLEVDRYLLLDLIGTDLPLALTIPRINDDVYWKRCYTERWPLNLPHDVKPLEIYDIFRSNDVRKLSGVYTASGTNGSNSVIDNLSERGSIASLQISKIKVKALEKIREKNIDAATQTTWKKCYIEMHMKEYLESLKPEKYDAEKMKELSDLCSPYIKVLKIEELQCSENSEARIPLNSILTGFQNLKELSLCFKQKFIGEQFTWNVLRTSPHDITLLAKGLEKLRLQVLRIHNSDIDCEKLITVLRALLKHEIEVLDFAHCKIADRGAIALSKFSLDVPVTKIILTNNQIGIKGVKSLAYTVCQESCQIVELDLHLNRIADGAGNFLFEALTVGAKKLKSLFLRGCGFSETISVDGMLRTNNSLEMLDISCNNIGENVGQKILDVMQYNSSIKKLDLKMCKISSETEFAIYELVNKNRKKKIELVDTTEENEIENKEMFTDEELLMEMEKIFQ